MTVDVGLDQLVGSGVCQVLLCKVTLYFPLSVLYSLEETPYTQATFKKWKTMLSLPWLGQLYQQAAGPVGCKGQMLPAGSILSAP